MTWSKEWNSLDNFKKTTLSKYQVDHIVKLGDIAKEFGIKVKLATLKSNISGQIQENSEGVLIKINRHDVKARQRYTLAHEIAHFLLHRHLLKDGITDDVLYRSKLSDKIETEANQLAADIIMPMSSINFLISTIHKDKKNETLYEALAEDLGVSTIALKYRLEKS
jgi:Zn-dependent peptidase ImmA (M78 family)